MSSVRQSSALEIAQTVLDEIRKNVVNLNDIVPYNVLNRLNTEEKTASQIELRMRIEISRQRIKHLRDVATAVLTIYEKEVEGRGQNGRFNVIMTRLAITSFGYGECGENADLAVYKLLQQGITEPVYFVGIESSQHKIHSNHGFVIIGDCEKLKEKKFEKPAELLAALQALPEECILVDAYLNYVGPVNRLPALFKVMVINEGMCSVNVLEKMNYLSSFLEALRKSAEILVQNMGVVRSKFPDLRWYQGLLADYKTFTSVSESGEKVEKIYKQLNSQNTDSKIMITNPAKRQISFLRSWLKSTDSRELDKIATQLQTPSLK